MSEKLPSFPLIDRLESRLLISYGIVLFCVLLMTSLFTGYYFKYNIEKDQQRLALLTSEILHNSIEQTFFSGKFHTRLFIENLAQQYPDIISIQVYDKNGKVIAHSNEALNNSQVDFDLLVKLRSIVSSEKKYITEPGKEGDTNVINIYLPFRKGYKNKIQGVIHVAISSEFSEQSELTGLIALIVLIIVLMMLGTFAIKKLSHFFSAPVVSMARVLKGIMDHAPLLIMVLNRHKDQLYKSKLCEQYVAGEDKDLFKEYIDVNAIQTMEKNLEFVHSGRAMALRSIHFPISQDKTGATELICCIAEDVTDKVAVEKQLITRERQLSQVLKGASLGFWDWSYQTGDYFVDSIWLDMLGLTQDEISNTVSDWKNRIHPDDKKMVLHVVEQAISEDHPFNVDFRMSHKKGGWEWVQSSGAVVEWDKKGRPFRLCGTHQNISKRKQDENELLFMANYDPLTRLPNRNLMHEKVNLLLDDRRKNKSLIALMFIDIDNFKIINDTYGHKFGDLFLLSIVSKFKEAISDDGFLGRFGGDEFVLIIDDAENIDYLSTVATKILIALEQPISLQENTVYASASIGISIHPQDGDDFDTLLKNADAAMYKAKEAGKNGYCFFTETINQEIQNHLKIASKLRDAIDNSLLELAYQPQVDTASGEIRSCEALLRWNDAEEGYISPAVFIDIAEKTNLIMAIDDWVIEHACRQHYKWQKMGLKNFRIDINLSGRQFNDKDVIDKIQKHLDDYQLQASEIGLELTESVLIEGDQQGLETIHKLRDLGFEIALDDFGTGYSSLSYLKQFPVSTLKIDRSFIVDAPLSQDGAALVNAIIAMAEALGLSVVAEGVETEQQYRFIKGTSCQAIQGYYFYKPMFAAEIEKILFT